jgi:hypothetical protein
MRAAIESYPVVLDLLVHGVLLGSAQKFGSQRTGRQCEPDLQGSVTHQGGLLRSGNVLRDGSSFEKHKCRQQSQRCQHCALAIS